MSAFYCAMVLFAEGTTWPATNCQCIYVYQRFMSMDEHERMYDRDSHYNPDFDIVDRIIDVCAR